MTTEPLIQEEIAIAERLAKIPEVAAIYGPPSPHLKPYVVVIYMRSPTCQLESANLLLAQQADLVSEYPDKHLRFELSYYRLIRRDDRELYRRF